MMSTLTVHYQWEDEMVRERTCHPPIYAEAKKMKSLTLHTHGCLRASLRDSPSSLYMLLITLPSSEKYTMVCKRLESLAIFDLVTLFFKILFN